MKLSHKLRVFLILSISISFVSNAVFAACECCESCSKEQPLAVTPAPRLVTHSWMSLAKWYHMHAEDVEEAEKGEAKIVLVGDSITEGWQWGEGKFWNEVLAPMGAVNQGIGGDMTQNVLWRLDHGSVMNLNPDYVICLIGTNNFGHTDENPEQVSKGVVAVVKKLSEVYPDAHILSFAVFPRSQNVDHPDRAKIKELNTLVAAEVQNIPNLTFLDIGEQFLSPDGSISNEIMPDYLHLSEKGYEIWLKAILDWMKATPTLVK